MKTIKSKIIAMLMVASGGAVIVGGSSLWTLWHVATVQERSERQADLSLATERINSAVTAVVMDSRGVYLAKTRDEVEKFARPNEERLRALGRMVAELGTKVGPDDRERFARLQAAVAEFIGFRTETIRLAREVSIAAADAQGNNDLNRKNRQALNDLLVSYSADNERLGDAFSAEARRVVSLAETTLPAALLAILCASFFGALRWTSRSVTRPLQDATAAMEVLAHGDVSVAIPHVDREDEIGTMARTLEVFRAHAEQMKALEAQERRAEAERAARAESMMAVVHDVGEVVAAAAAGDFSARLEIESTDDQMRKLVGGINEINAVVDRATTEFAEALGRVAKGDLTQTIATAYRGRFADLKMAINETIATLSETVATIQTTAVDVASASREIQSGADDLSRRTEEQASSLEQTAATTEELAASVKASAQASRHALETAEDAMRVAEGGGQIVSQAIDAMARIEQASQKISDITSVIDEIAFQTNLLALNAAVEAARAGEAGKGFAVVASEVRTLAQRSSEAAKDITGLITSSTTEVAQGVRLVRSAGESLDRIVSASRKVASTVDEISSAAAEQANGIDEMSQAVAHLDEMTQQNAALAEQSAASAASLTGQIERLNDVAATFRTGQGASAQGRPPAAPSEPARLRERAASAFAGRRAARG
ncbi:methyl-accepting chemotaxis protein [Alsobacter sp. KACC 23698]|uniref:Methyl-accepting chemotaxis protein n=1 Tax=Alsobacter sp. KACC 23698 TaxID=3149229 RepID=A0AAU7JG23_9HYPH